MLSEFKYSPYSGAYCLSASPNAHCFPNRHATSIVDMAWDTARVSKVPSRQPSARTRGCGVSSQVRLSPYTILLLILALTSYHHIVQDIVMSDSLGVANNSPPLCLDITPDKLLVLRSHEIWWRDRYEMLLSHGYQLRPRLRPGWVPSWIANGKRPMQSEDFFALLVCSTSTLIFEVSSTIVGTEEQRC